MSSTKTRLLDSAQKNLLKGQFAKAVADYRQIIQLDPSDMRHRQKLAEILTKANLKDEAVIEYTSLAKHYIDSVHYLKAIAVYKQIQKLEPANPEVSLTLASLNEKQGLIGNASAEYASALQIYEKNAENTKALRVLESMLALDPGNSAVRLRIAEKYFTIGKEKNSFDEFLALASDLKNRNDESGFIHVSEKINYLFKERAQELFSKIAGDEQAEDNSIEAPITEMPETEPVKIVSAPVQEPSTEVAQADESINESSETTQPISTIETEEVVEDIPLIEDLEEIEELEELFAEEQEWEEDIDFDLEDEEPSSDDALSVGQKEYLEPEPIIELDDLELVDFDLELELEDDDLEGATPLPLPDALSSQDSVNIDAPFDLAGELSIFADEIDFDLIKTSASDPPFSLDTASGFKRNELDNEDAESHYSLGLAYKEMGLFDEAISEFIVASRSQERKIDALILQAVCFRELGQAEKAVEILSDMLNFPEIKDDELLGVKYELAICHETEGNKTLARQLYTEIMTIRPDFSDTATRIVSL